VASGILQQSFRVAIYARVSTAHNGQDPSYRHANFRISAGTAAGL